MALVDDTVEDFQWTAKEKCLDEEKDQSQDKFDDLVPFPSVYTIVSIFKELGTLASKLNVDRAIMHMPRAHRAFLDPKRMETPTSWQFLIIEVTSN